MKLEEDAIQPLQLLLLTVSQYANVKSLHLPCKTVTWNILVVLLMGKLISLVAGWVETKMTNQQGCCKVLGAESDFLGGGLLS